MRRAVASALLPGGCFAALAMVLIALPARAGEKPPTTSICLMLDSAAAASHLPVAFLTRIIWRESRFDADAIGPRTRGGQHAQGIAQFMPGTAAERDLTDPFDPVQALPKAAAFLRDLANRFGNLGLAAAAYNAGPQRVSDWLAGTRTLPEETKRYVLAVTGRSAEEWAKAGAAHLESKADCETTVASLGHAPSAFAYELEKRVREAIMKPWGVELAAGFSRAHVLHRYARAMQQLSDVIGDQDPVITKAVLRSRGTDPFYQARIGADTRHAADELCTRIRKVGGACLVLRNRRR